MKMHTIDYFDDPPYEFLSNFYPARVEFEGIWYPTTEHAYQAAKSLKITDRMRIGLLPTAGQAKRAGQKVKLRPDWATAKFKVMEALVLQKFTRHPKLRHALQETGDAYLLEGNTWHDNVWGDCTCGRKKCRAKGQNNLGRILMEVRHATRRPA